MNDISLIVGRHAIEEALDGQKTIEKIFLARSVKGPFEKYLRHECRERTIPLAYVEKSKLDRMTRSNHQGVVAYTSPITYYKPEALIPHLIEQVGNPLIVALDGVTDVRNVGAIARSCEVLGASAMILPTDRTALINEFAMKTSAGAIMHLDLCRTHSLVNTADYLISSGFELIGLDGTGQADIADFTPGGGPMALILGDEEKGIRKPLREKCHKICRIHQIGQTESLNVSVAAGIALYSIMQKMHR